MADKVKPTCPHCLRLYLMDWCCDVIVQEDGTPAETIPMECAAVEASLVRCTCGQSLAVYVEDQHGLDVMVCQAWAGVDWEAWSYDRHAQATEE